jgi:hypothetical protein
MIPPNNPSHRPLHATSGFIARFHAEEAGMLSVANTVFALFCVLLMVLILNVGHLLHRKMELENAAQNVTISGANWFARGMNAITATNHVIGEVLSFVVLHDALGGKKLDRNEVEDTKKVDDGLDDAWQLAQSMGAATPAYETVRQREEGVRASNNAMICICKVRLKKYLTEVYLAKYAAKCMQLYPPTHAAGVALEKTCDAIELKILQEYQVLNVLQKIARALTPLKVLVRDRFLPQAKRYTTRIRDEVPQIALQTAEELGTMHESYGTLFGPPPQMPTLARRADQVAPLPAYAPRLPVEIDPFAQAFDPGVREDAHDHDFDKTCGCDPEDQTTNMRRQIVKTTQLARATFPWVNYHRGPVVDLTDSLLTLCDGGQVYVDCTAGHCIDLCDELQLSPRHDLGLYVVRGYSAPDKGRELWTDDAERVDRLFTLVGLAHREAPYVLGQPAVFSQAHPDGMLAFSQAILYNANPQHRPNYRINMNCKPLVPRRQAAVGWDTLNWAPGCRPYELSGKRLPPEYPKIQVNWQAKLVPISKGRYRELTSSQSLPAPFLPVVKRLLDNLPDPLHVH